jgi:outer membrane protein
MNRLSTFRTASLALLVCAFAAHATTTTASAQQAQQAPQEQQVSQIASQKKPEVSAGAPVRTFTLEECLKIAVSENLDVQNALADISSAANNVRQAKGLYLPSLTASFQYSRSLNDRQRVNIGNAVIQEVVLESERLNNFTAGLNAGFLAFDFFRRENNVWQAEANLEASEGTEIQTRRRILAAIRSQYIAVLRAQQIVAVRREDVVVGKKQLDRIRAQYEAGTVAVAPVYTQEADLGQREVSLVQAENDLEIAKGTLLASLGMSPTMPADFSETSVQTALKDDDVRGFRTTIGTMQSLMTQSLTKRADYAAAQASIRAAEAGLAAQKAAYLPAINLGGGWNWGNYQLSAFDQGRASLGAQVSYQILDNSQRDVSHQVAQIQLQQAQIRRKQIEQRVGNDIQTAYTQLSTAEKQLDITTRSLKAAEQNFNAAEERFKVGAANILDYTTANGTFVTARINRLNAVYNYIAAQYQVRFATGTLDNE